MRKNYLLEALVFGLEQDHVGAPIEWDFAKREKSIIQDSAEHIARSLHDDPLMAPYHVRQVSFWLFSLFRHGHWKHDTPDIFPRAMCMEVSELSLCTGLLAMGVPLGGSWPVEWPVEWPDTLSDLVEFPLLILLADDRERLESLASSIRHDSGLAPRLDALAHRMQKAVR